MCDSTTGCFFFPSLLGLISSLPNMNPENKYLQRNFIDLAGKTVLTGNLIFFAGSIEAIQGDYSFFSLYAEYF